MVQAKGHLHLKDKLLKDAILSTIRVARESFKESDWLSWHQEQCPPPYGSSAREEQERKDFKTTKIVFYLFLFLISKLKKLNN